jgi:hypothetical protein
LLSAKEGEEDLWFEFKLITFHYAPYYLIP